MKVSKKNIAITGVAVSLAAVMLIGGGTFAYLKGETDPITNSFRTNQVQATNTTLYQAQLKEKTLRLL